MNKGMKERNRGPFSEIDLSNISQTSTPNNLQKKYNEYQLNDTQENFSLKKNRSVTNIKITEDSSLKRSKSQEPLEIFDPRILKKYFESCHFHIDKKV